MTELTKTLHNSWIDEYVRNIGVRMITQDVISKALETSWAVAFRAEDQQTWSYRWNAICGEIAGARNLAIYAVISEKERDELLEDYRLLWDIAFARSKEAFDE